MTAEADTKTRILDAAARLFAEQGLEGVSLRAVTTEAGVNLAAVNYHFGSKEALLAAMGQRFFNAMSAGQAAGLDALLASDDLPSVAALLTAYAAPVFAQFDAHRGQDWARVWMLTRAPDRPGRGMMPPMQSEAGAAVTRQYVAALRQILPQLPPEELAWRFERAVALLMANQGKRLSPAYMSQAANASATNADERAWLITFLAGALEAPPTGSSLA